MRAGSTKGRRGGGSADVLLRRPPAYPAGPGS